MGWLDKIGFGNKKTVTTGTNPDIAKTPNGQGYYNRKTGKQIPTEDVVPVKDDKGYIVGYRIRQANEPKRNKSGNVRQGAITTKTVHSESYNNAPNSIINTDKNISISPSNLIGADYNKPRHIQ